MIRVFEAFAGIGSQSMALRNIGVDFKVVGISEIDKYAIESYRAINGEVYNIGDISQVNPNDIPDHDLFTYSFPCQDISIAGKQKSLAERSGTRSSLLWYCKNIIDAKKPKYLLLENVKNLIGKKHKKYFDDWLEYLEQQGYENHYEVLNAKDYGVPQNRERIFVVSILGGGGYTFPSKIDLTISLRDMLENEVDAKYYFESDKSKIIVERLRDKLDKSDYNTFCCDSSILADRERVVSNYITARYNAGIQNRTSIGLNVIERNKSVPKQILSYETSYPIKKRKYKVDCKALSKILIEHKKNINISCSDIAKKLSVSVETVEHWFRTDNSFAIPHEDIWYSLKNILKINTDLFDESILTFIINESKFAQSNRFVDIRQINPTIMATGENAKIIDVNYKIRKLTPLECWRLMGFYDEDYYKAKAQLLDIFYKGKDKSDSQMYKQAGNSIVVPVLEGIFKQLFINR